MNDILLLTKSYFHKAKSQTVALVMLITIAVTLLNAGFLVQVGMSSFFDERAEELNAGHFVTVVDPQVDASEVEQFLTHHEAVLIVEQSETLFTWGDVFVGDSAANYLLFFQTEAAIQTMNPPSLIGDYLPLEGDVIYIPHFIMIDNGHEIGDSFRLNFSGRDFWFTIGGSTEEILLASMMASTARFYISDEMFQTLQAEFPGLIHTMLTARLENHEESIHLLNDFNNESFLSIVDGSAVNSFAQSYEAARSGRLMFPNVLSMTIIALATIIFVVSVVMIRFRIKSNIEEQIKNLGIQKAIGYQSKQIICSIALQFAIIAGLGGILGTLMTVLVMPAVAGVFEGLIGLVWQPAIELVASGSILLGTVVLILLIAYLAVRPIKKIYPLVALREGITTHNFKKNYFSLEKARGSLPLVLSLKQMLQNKKQMLTMIVMTAGITFMAVASLTIFHNMVIDNESFSNLIAGAVADVRLVLDDSDDALAFQERMANLPEVERIYGMIHGGYPAQINDWNINFLVAENTDYLGEHMLVDGRFPIHANEMAVSPVLARQSEFGIGETVVVTYHDVTEEFLITGVIQSFQDAGLFSLLTGEGFSRLDSNFVFRYFNVDLHEGVDIDEFIDRVLESEGENFEMIANFADVVEAGLAGMNMPLTVVAFGSVSISVLVVVLVQYMMIKMMLTRRHKELGIQKALGFTNIQLMNQMALNLSPIVLVGILVGGVLGYFGFNPMMLAFISGEGIGRINLQTPISWVIILAIGMAVLSYITALFIARRIRKISAYQLVSE